MDDQEIRDRLKNEKKEKLTFSSEDRQQVFRKIERNGQPKQRFFVQLQKTVPVFATILFLVTVAGVLLPSVLSDHSWSDDSRLGSNNNEKPFTILLLGMDDNKRVDANVFVSYNPKQKSAKIVSIPRDAYVPIITPDGETLKKDKLVNSYMLGTTKGAENGIETTVKTVSNFLDVSVDYYAMVDMKGFVELIDSMGGMDFGIEYSQRVKGMGGTVHQLEKGKRHLSGDELLGLMRERFTNPEGDNGRIKMHTKFVVNLMAQSVGNLKSSDIKDLMRSVETNLPIDRIVQLAGSTKADPTVKTLFLLEDSEPTRVDGIYSLNIDEHQIEKVSDEIKDHLDRKE